MTTPGQTRAIHAMRRKAGMPDEDYRALLSERFGVTSSGQLSDAAAAHLIDELRKITGVTPTEGRELMRTASGRYAPVLRALWISAYHLGVARSRDDAALIAFAQRQTGIDHLRFMTDPADARRVIEALKTWIARDGGVDWPDKEDVSHRCARRRSPRCSSRGS